MKELNFINRGLKWSNEDDVKEVTDILQNESGLQIITLSGNTLGVSAAKLIGKCLESQNNLKTLVWSDLFTGRLRAEIPVALESLCQGISNSNSKVEELDLSDNAFGPAGIIALHLFFNSHASDNLKILRFNNNGMGIDGGKVLAGYLKECHKRCLKAGTKFALKEFYAGRNRLENRGAKALAGAFKLIGTLEVVSVPQNGIYHEGITALSEAFAANASMKTINLNDNTATHLGAFSLSKAILNVTHLQYLNVGDCLLKDKGAVYIAKAFKQSGGRTLKELTLNNNEISIKGGLEIVGELAEVPVKTLELNGNCFGQTGVQLIRSKLKSLKKMEMIKSLSEDEGTGDEESEQSSYENISGGEADDYEDDYQDEEADEDVVADEYDRSELHDDVSGEEADDIVMVGRKVFSPKTIFESTNKIPPIAPKGDVFQDFSKVLSFSSKGTASTTPSTINTFNFSSPFPDTFKSSSSKMAPTISLAISSTPTKTTNAAVITPFTFKTNTITPNFDGRNIFDSAPKYATLHGPFSLTTEKKATEIVGNFMSDPRLEILKAYSTAQNYTYLQIFKDYLKQTHDADKVGELFFKVCNGREVTGEQVKAISPQIASDVIEAAMAMPDINENQLASSLMVHLGLLKSEDKKFKPPSAAEMEKPLKALEFILLQPYLSNFLRDALKTFMKRQG